MALRTYSEKPLSSLGVARTMALRFPAVADGFGREKTPNPTL